jgi:protein SCO1
MLFRTHHSRRAGFALLRFVALGLALAVWTASFLAVTTATAAPMRLEDYEAGPYALGGDFTLTNQLGKPASLKDYKGRVTLVFFGYTYCPDVCPTTLTEMSKMRKLLGAQAKRVESIFITVDPARDTAPRLKSYLSNFGPGIAGMTGTEDAIREVAKRYNARFTRSSSTAGGGYLMDHTGFVYLLDGTGKVRYLFTYDAGADLFARGARKLLAEPQPKS